MIFVVGVVVWLVDGGMNWCHWMQNRLWFFPPMRSLLTRSTLHSDIYLSNYSSSSSLSLIWLVKRIRLHAKETAFVDGCWRIFLFFFFEKSRCGRDAHQTYGGWNDSRDEPQHVLLMAIITQNYIFIYKHTHAHLRSFTNTHVAFESRLCSSHNFTTAIQWCRQLSSCGKRGRDGSSISTRISNKWFGTETRQHSLRASRALRSPHNKFIKIIYFRKLNIKWTRARRERGSRANEKTRKKKRNRNVYETAQRFTKINDRISKIFTPRCKSVRERVSE